MPNCRGLSKPIPARSNFIWVFTKCLDQPSYEKTKLILYTNTFFVVSFYLVKTGILTAKESNERKLEMVLLKFIKKMDQLK